MARTPLSGQSSFPGPALDDTQAYSYNISATPAPMTLFNTDSGAESGAIAQIAAPPADVGTPAGGTLTYTGGATGASWGWISAAGTPNLSTWPSGDYAISLAVPYGSPDLEVTEIQIYRVDQNGGPGKSGLALVGDKPGVDRFLNAGYYVFNVAGAAQTASPTDRLGVVFIMKNTASTSQSFTYSINTGIDDNVLNVNPPTTGINSWWTYDVGDLPGQGAYAVNVGNGNLLVQADDVDIPERGIDLAFRRTYNSQSSHDQYNSDSSVPSNFGDGWTNTFDAHLAYDGTNAISVYDTDGARYDYTADGNGNWLPPPGQHATLVWDGECGYQWTKTDGTTFYFYSPDLNDSPTCVGGIGYPQDSAYGGRLFQIIGRNNNNYLSFAYAFGDPTNPSTLSEIDVTHSDGSTQVLKLAFGQQIAGGPTELLTITCPDQKEIAYQYDTTQGSLLQYVMRPGNNGGSITESYAYNSNTHQLSDVASPRYNASTSDGDVTAFTYDSLEINGHLTQINDQGLVNFIPADGTGTYLQDPAPASTPLQTWRTVDFSGYGSGSTAMTDSDGHSMVWSVDAVSRVFQAQMSTGESSPASLTTSATWDANNNAVETIDPRGEATDYVYDAEGNLTEMALPAVSVNGTQVRPTSLYSYASGVPSDVIAYCDPVFTNSSSVNKSWPVNGPTPSPGETPCPSEAGAERFVWGYGGYSEQYGCLTQIDTPAFGSGSGLDPGNQTNISYGSTQGVCGNDGLVSQIQSVEITKQADGNPRTPTENFAYDSYGNLTCYSKNGGTHWYRMEYDNMNRKTAVSDPDDATLPASVSCPGSEGPGISGSYIVNTTSYYDDGTVKSTQSPSESARGVSTTYSYDPDGNRVKATLYRMTSSTATPAPATTTYFYDGDDRPVEVQQPRDPSHDLYTKAWTTRYLYDLSQNNTIGSEPAFNGMVSYSAHGNLFKTQELLPSTNPFTASSPAPQSVANTTFLDIDGNAFDGLDRPTTRYSLIAETRSSPESLIQETLTYDTSNYFGGDFAGELTEACNSASPQQCSWNNYDADGSTTQVHYSDSSTPDVSATYDADGRTIALTSAVSGSKTYTYDADGYTEVEQEASGGGITSPATFTHEYYSDGMLKQLDVASSALTQSGLFDYSYRQDGKIETLSVNDANQANVGTTTDSFTYTDAGRPTERNESGTGAFSSPDSWQYDLFGRLSQLNLPQCSWCIAPANGNPQVSGFIWDPEDQLMATASQTFNYTMRGESLEGSSYLAADGFYVPSGVPSVTWDTQSGASLYGTYDSAGRMLTMGNSPWSMTRTYDAENHTISASTPQASLTSGETAVIDGGLGLYNWGPSGHPVRIGSAISTSPAIPSPSSVTYDTLHWDGDQLIFTTNPSGQVDDIRVGASGDITPLDPWFTGITFYDRGPDGSVMGCHNATGASDSLTLAPYPGAQQCATTSYTQDGHRVSFATSTLWDPQSQPGGPGNFSILWEIGIGQGKVLGMPRSDGIIDGFNTIQGVRTYDADANQWTTPDAFAGSVGDPASQKPYLWNGGNPLINSDPTGNDPSDPGGEVITLIPDIPDPTPDAPVQALIDVLFMPGMPMFHPAPPLIRGLSTISHVVAHPHGPWCSSYGWATAPKTGENYSEVWANGVAHRYDSGPVKNVAAIAAVGMFGRYDWQRSFPFGRYPQWRRASNVNVGIWSSGAGYTKAQMNQNIESVLNLFGHTKAIPEDEMVSGAAYMKSQYLCHR